MDMDRIYHGDCVCGMKEKLLPESVDLVIADPPGPHTFAAEGAYYTWSAEWIGEAARAMRSGGSLYLFGNFHTLCHLLPILEEKGLELRQQILVTKGTEAAGNGKHRTRFPTTVESIFLLCKDARPFVSGFLKERQVQMGLSSKEINDLLGVKSNGGGMWSHYTGNLAVKQLPTEAVWGKLSEILQFDLPYHRITQTFNAPDGLSEMWNDVKLREEKDRLHPSQKTQKLLTRLLCISSNPGDVVLDPFVGSGSTAEACLYNNRRYIGFESNKAYYEMAVERVANRQLTMF